MRIEHDIFNTPNKVDLTIEERPTPAAYARYEHTATMPMWRVQTEGYTDGTDQLVGVVSRDSGFLDSPDTEWISSGVNSKNPHAVAIGRHGNFLHWGFAASPTYMTEEARLVFINAVHYIARFAGQTPIARKRPGTMMRESVTQALDGISEQGYAQIIATYQAIGNDIAKQKVAIQARIDAGEKVAAQERAVLDMSPPRMPGRFDGIKRFVAAEAWSKIEGDEQAIRAYITKRLSYMRSQGWYELVVDEDLERFGVANDDIALLDKAVAALATGRDAELARTLLERYTDVSFATAAEWGSWLQANREHLFFTESGGYKWLVNRLGTPHSGKPAETNGVSPGKRTADLAPTAGSPLAAAIAVAALDNGRLAVTVRVKILDGWHAYDDLPKGAAYAPTTLDLELPPGFEQATAWQRPKGRADGAERGLSIYEGAIAFRCEIAGKVPSTPVDVVCRFGYQVCDEQMCMPPTSVKLTARIAAAGQKP
ncbi:MAG TPA: protein-disulfide reductase DsbD domain-containing protein [Planctomycetota bacterium]|nr:protein-disulfide reductase DsbD domain-containing protein [Planctomycetota bacterium]